MINKNKIWENKIVKVPNFPKKGIIFFDLLPIFENTKPFQSLINDLSIKIPSNTNCIVGIDARGFIIGAAVAYDLKIGFVPVRKKGKLPGKVFSETYNYEYGHAALEISKNAFAKKKSYNVTIIDDVCATGNTIFSTIKLLKNFPNIEQIRVLTIMNISVFNTIKAFKNINIHYDCLKEA